MKEEKHKTSKNISDFDQQGNTYFGAIGVLVTAFSVTWVITMPLDFRVILILFSSTLFIRKFYLLFFLSIYLVLLIQYLTIKLDQKYNWDENFKQRLVKQMIFCWFLPLLLYYLVYFTLMGTNFLPKATPGHNLIMAVIGVNVVYGVHNKLTSRKVSPSEVDKTPERAVEAAGVQLEKTSLGIYNVPFGNGFIPVAYEDIAFFWRDGNILYMQCLDGSQYVIREPPKEIEKGQQNDFFFPITRDYLASRKSILSAKVNRKRGFTIELINGKKLDMCRKKTNDFEAFYGPVKRRSLIKAGQIKKTQEEGSSNT